MDIGVLKTQVTTALTAQNATLGANATVSIIGRADYAAVAVKFNGKQYVVQIDDATLSEASGASNEQDWANANIPALAKQILSNSPSHTYGT